MGKSPKLEGGAKLYNLELTSKAVTKGKAHIGRKGNMVIRVGITPKKFGRPSLFSHHTHYNPQ